MTTPWMMGRSPSMIASYGSHCGHGARSTCALQFPTPSNGVIATRDISGNVPEPVLVVPDDEDKTMVFLLSLFNSPSRFLQYRVIVYVDDEYDARLFIRARDLDLDTGSGVATQVGTLLYRPPLHGASRKPNNSIYNTFTSSREHFINGRVDREGPIHWGCQPSEGGRHTSTNA